jgi:hypothetical protein
VWLFHVQVVVVLWAVVVLLVVHPKPANPIKPHNPLTHPLHQSWRCVMLSSLHC